MTAVVAVGVMLPAAWGQEATQPAAEIATEIAAEPAPAATGGSATGTVKGNDVFVRSGFHQNYYPVTKLNKGDRVTVLGEEYGWLKIVPPAGTYSLVEKALIDKVDDRTGRANGEAMVYAGSNLNDRRYAKQLKLATGEQVEVIGETADGAFYKIQPPPGATLWIKADLVDRGDKPVIEKVRPGELDLTAETAATTTQPAGGREAPPRTLAAAPRVEANQTQMDINAIEALVSAETVKPLSERRFEPIIEKLKPMADQKDDLVAQMYAQTRIKQLQEEMAIVEAVGEIRTLKEQAIATADAEAARRMLIQAEPAAPMDDIAIRGEIQVSGVYDGRGGRTQRWRVVEPGTRQTLAYIELASGSPIDPVQYYGKFVGIRASARRLTDHTSPPLPIFTVQEIVVLDPLARRGAAMASQQPPAVPEPAVESEPAEPLPAAETQPPESGTE